MRHSSKIAMFNVLCLLEVCYSLLENILLVKFKIEFIKLQFRMGCFSSWKFGKLQDLMHLSYGGFTVHTIPTGEVFDTQSSVIYQIEVICCCLIFYLSFFVFGMN